MTMLTAEMHTTNPDATPATDTEEVTPLVVQKAIDGAIEFFQHITNFRLSPVVEAAIKETFHAHYQAQGDFNLQALEQEVVTALGTLIQFIGYGLPDVVSQIVEKSRVLIQQSLGMAVASQAPKNSVLAPTAFIWPKIEYDVPPTDPPTREFSRVYRKHIEGKIEVVVNHTPTSERIPTNK